MRTGKRKGILKRFEQKEIERIFKEPRYVGVERKEEIDYYPITEQEYKEYRSYPKDIFRVKVLYPQTKYLLEEIKYIYHISFYDEELNNLYTIIEEERSFIIESFEYLYNWVEVKGMFEKHYGITLKEYILENSIYQLEKKTRYKIKNTEKYNKICKIYKNSKRFERPYFKGTRRRVSEKQALENINSYSDYYEMQEALEESNRER